MTAQMQVIAEKRFIDPNTPVEKQFAVLQDLMKRWPDNSRIVVFSPELAEKILQDLNARNRQRRPVKIRAFAKDMIDNAWSLTGDTIKFSKAGRLLDGQNRLAACVLSGKRLKTHAIFGIDDDAFAYIDTGTKRTNPDALHTIGIANSKTVAQAIRWLLIGLEEEGNRGLSVSNPEILAYYRDKIDRGRMTAAVESALKLKRQIPAGALAAHIYWLSAIDKKTTNQFVSELVARKYHSRAHTLLSVLKTARERSMGRLHETLYNALIVITWKAYRDDTKLTPRMLNWGPGRGYPNVRA